MKRIFLTAALICSLVAAEAQDKMTVWLKSQDKVEYDIEKVDRVTFDESQTPVNPPVTPPEKSFRLKTAGQYTFDYDDQGRCYAISSEEFGLEWAVDFAKGKVTLMGLAQGDVEFNEMGYLTRLKFSIMGVDSDMQLRYDPEGHMESVSTQQSSAWGMYLNQEIYFTWQDGDMIKSRCVVSTNEEGEVENYEETITFTYGTPNPLRQWAFCMFASEDVSSIPLYMADLFGVAPAHFPSKIRCVLKDETETFNPSFTFNSDGTLSTESGAGDGTIDYTYYEMTRSEARAVDRIKGLFRFSRR